MVGVPEFGVWWPAALFSEVVSLDGTLATLSAPSGCVTTHTQTQADLTETFPLSVPLPGAFLLCMSGLFLVPVADPDPPVVAAGGRSVWSLRTQVVGDCGHSRGLQRHRAASENHRGIVIRKHLEL